MGHRRLAEIAFQIEIEAVLPRGIGLRAALDLAEIDVVPGEGLETLG